MWYPEILNAMSKFMENNPQTEVTLCSALKDDIESKNFTQISNEVNNFLLVFKNYLQSSRKFFAQIQ